jgi:Tol biopolymer transport system component
MLPFGASSPVLTLADAGLVGLDPSVSPDGLTLYTQYNPSNFVEVVYGTRLTPSGGFNYPTGVPGLSGGAPNHGAPFLQASSALWWAARVEPDGGATQGAGSLDIFVAQLTGPGAITGASAVPELTTIYDETSPALTPDGLTVYFARKEATDGGASATFHVYSSTRGVETDPFPTPALVSELDDMPTTNTQPTWIAPDDCVIYLTSDRDGPAGAIYTAARPL